MDIVEATKHEWRELGFHYDLDDAARLWTITGSIEGLANFITILRDFAGNPRNDTPCEHDHYGPYGYLKIMNTPGERGFNSNAIHAPREDFANLANEIDLKLLNAKVDSRIRFKHTFCPDSEYDLEIVVKPNDFDPGMFDSWVKQQLAEDNNS